LAGGGVHRRVPGQFDPARRHGDHRQSFPTPFSGGPPNLSPAWLNVVWSLINVAIGYGLLRLIARWRSLPAVRWTMVVAAGLAAIGLSFAFAGLWTVPVAA
jgi:hypothetical protein